MDGDHDNNDPDNLVLIWGPDHADLHSGPPRSHDRPWKSEEDIAQEKETAGQQAYELRLQQIAWGQMGIPNALLVAKFYAKKNGLEWPLRVRTKKEVNTAALVEDGYPSAPVPYRA